MAAPRRRKMIGRRRRIEDEGDDEVAPDALDLDADSLTDGSIITDDHDGAGDSDTSNADEASPTSPGMRKSANGHGKGSIRRKPNDQPEPDKKPVSDSHIMLHGLVNTDHPAPVQEMTFDEVTAVSPVKSQTGPVIVSSASASRPQTATLADRRRQEHEDYRRKRDEDPAFVPNRGSFFMHDHRHAGPAANGFRPFGRGRGRGNGGRGVFGAPFAPFIQMHPAGDSVASSVWTHDMHESVAASNSRRSRQVIEPEGPANGDGVIPTCRSNSEPINRTMSTEKHIGNVQLRVLLPEMESAINTSGMLVKQYTRLPDHRPPLRSDKPVRISLPNYPPRYIFPAKDRSFTFIPRAMRPNQQRVRGKPRSGMGSIGGFSRRTSVFGGSYHGGSNYSPSVAMSRRSSIHDRDYLFSPAGSVVSRPLPPGDGGRPVVKLPPANTRADLAGPGSTDHLFTGQLTTVSVNVPQQLHSIPVQPLFPENRQPPASYPPLHQPRPQKNISIADIDSSSLAHSLGPQPFHGAFHQQVPLQVANGFHESHSRQPSFSQHSRGTPLSQIPERAIHAAPFQPNALGQPPYYSQPYQAPSHQGYYYDQSYPGSNVATAPHLTQPGMADPEPHALHGVSASSGSNLVAQQVNGMVYYYDASQLPPVNMYPPYADPQGYQTGGMPMGGVVNPSPDAYYYPHHQSGIVYYP